MEVEKTAREARPEIQTEGGDVSEKWKRGEGKINRIQRNEHSVSLGRGKKWATRKNPMTSAWKKEEKGSVENFGARTLRKRSGRLGVSRKRGSPLEE